MTGMLVLLMSLPSWSVIEQRFTSEWPGTGNDVLEKQNALFSEIRVKGEKNGIN